jgi:dTMP kinase
MSFITIEGGEGTGKSTLIRGLAEALKLRGLNVVVTREPGGTQGAEQIRDLLVKGDVARWSPTTELLLINAARRDHVERVITPALNDGAIVLCDRFIDSTRVYQGLSGVPYELILEVHEKVIGLNPDRTLILDAPPEIGLRRSAERGGDARFEAMGLGFHSKLRDGFLAIARTEQSRCKLIDGTQAVDSVLATALAALDI